MNLCLLSLFSRRFSRLTLLFTLIACLAGFGPALQAQSAHFSGAFRIHRGTPPEASGNAVAAGVGVGATPDIQTTNGNFGSVKVGASSASPIAIVFTFDASVTLGSTAVVTQGAPNLDFTDVGGGTCKANTAYIKNDTCTVNVTFKPRFPGTRYGAAVLLDTSGNLLALGYVQGTGVGPLAVFANTTSGDYLPAVQAVVKPVVGYFDSPSGVAVDGSGNVFVVNWDRSTVVEIVAAGGYTTNKTLSSGLNEVQALAVDGAGNIFVGGRSVGLDDGICAVTEIVAAGGYTTVKTLVSIPLVKVAEHAFADNYLSVAVDGAGNVFFAGTSESLAGNNAVKEIVAAGGYATIKTLVSGLNEPFGVAVDGGGNLFVCDSRNNAVKEIMAAGGYTTIKTMGSGFSDPSGVAVDGSGNVFVGDRLNHAVKEIMAAGGYTTIRTLGSGFETPEGVAVDGDGNVFVADMDGYSYPNVWRLDYADLPRHWFAVTFVGVESSDSPQTVTVSNNGNAALTFPIPASGHNPSVSSGFTLDATTTCPEVSASSSTAGKLAAGASCDYAVDFIPLEVGSDYGSLTLRDNTLNASPSVTQTVVLVGIGTGPHLAFTTPPPAALPVGHGPGTVAVGVEDAANKVVTTSSATVTLTVTGPSSYSKVYTATAASGIAKFSSLAVLSTVGTYTYTATDVADGLMQAVVTETVTLPPPFGGIGKALDSVTFSTTVGKSDSVNISGWVADRQDGAPLSNVTLYMDGTSIGKPTLGIARKDVLATYGNAYLNSGFQLSYPASSLALGVHKVTMVAIDSGGRSTTFGPHGFTVAATAGPGWPFGVLGMAADSLTLSTTISHSGTLKVAGWVADPQDGSPLSNVKVYVDGVSIGTPTLGLTRTDIAALYNNPAYAHSGYRLLYPASSLALGTHTVTMVAIDSGGRSTTFKPLTITVQ